MEKILITVRADENIKDMTDISFPFIEAYAKKCNAEILVLDTDIPNIHRHYRILQLKDLFLSYDRILNLDADILIKYDCPNIFDMISEDKIACIFEDKGTRQAHRRKTIGDIQAKRGDVGWREGYINTGFILFSKQYKEVFNVDENNLWEEPGYDDVELGYNMHKLNIQIHELPFQFNHMTMFSEQWNNYANRFNSYVIHYAGVGLFGPCKDRVEMMIQDAAILHKIERYA